jgi:hypothetical protein
MPNLTPDQKTLLTWMQSGQSIQVCSDYCPMKGTVTPKPRLPIRVFSKTINKLYQEGLISYQAKMIFGVRWDEFTLTDKRRATA